MSVVIQAKCSEFKAHTLVLCLLYFSGIGLSIENLKKRYVKFAFIFLLPMTILYNNRIGRTHNHTSDTVPFCTRKKLASVK